MDWALAAAGVALSLPLYFWHEIQRRIQYALLEPRAAVAAGSVYAATAVAGVLWAPAFTAIAAGPAIRALFILAAAGLTGGMTGLLLLRHLPNRNWTLQSLASRYAPASTAYALNAGMVFASQRFSLLVLASVVGIDAIGRTEAARLLTAPLMVIALGLAALTVPMVAHAFRDRSWPSIQHLIDRVTLASVLIAGCYGLLLVIGGRWLSLLVFDTVYDSTVTLGLMYCGIAAASLIASTLVAPLGAAGQASLVPRARLPGVLIVLLATFPAAMYIGEHGVVGLILIESCLSAALLRRAVHNSSLASQ
jgi:O-antigen/teichoic acid export membrane protein